MLNRVRQRGLSLVELMVGLVVSLLVLASATTLYITSVRGQSYALRGAKLNQELRAAASLMASEIRRAGYWSGIRPTEDAWQLARGACAATQQPFMRRCPDAMDDIAILDDGRCVVFSYDADSSGGTAPGNGDVFAFRLDTQARQVQMLSRSNTLTSTAACPSSGWIAITSTQSVLVDTLGFSFAVPDPPAGDTAPADPLWVSGSQCRNLSAGLAWTVQGTATFPACEAPVGRMTMHAGTAALPASGALMTEVRQVTLTITGRHPKDDGMVVTIVETVRLPNNRVFYQP